MKSKKRVMLIYGGISSEREISIISSIGINESLIRNNYDVIKIDADQNLEREIKKYKPDVVFNALHGTRGEEGKGQSKTNVGRFIHFKRTLLSRHKMQRIT